MQRGRAAKCPKPGAADHLLGNSVGAIESVARGLAGAAGGVACGWGRFGAPLPSGSAKLRLSFGGGAPTGSPWVPDSYLVDSASSHMLVSKIKPCMSKYKQLYRETANGSLNQLSFI
jgi:hypothetical protein